MALDYIKRLAGPYTGEGTTELPFGFRIFEETDVYVAKAADSDYTTESETLTYGSDYSVDMNEDQETNPGGTVTLVTALADSEVAVVGSAIEYTQEMELTNYSRFPPEIINTHMDRIVAQIQQLVEQLERTLTVPVTSDSTPEEMIASLMAAQEEAAQSAAEAATSASEAASSAEAAATSEANAAESADAADAAAVSIAYIADFPHIVETISDVIDDDTSEKGYYWVTGVTSDSGNTATTLAENLDSINIIVTYLDTLISLAGDTSTLLAAAEAADASASSASESATSASESATAAAESAAEAASSATAAAESASEIVLEAVTAFPYIVETLDDVVDHEQENGYFWVTGETSDSGNTATTLAESLDEINTIIENLDDILTVTEAYASLSEVEDLTTLFEATLEG